jgi:hypothetical protein
MNAERGICEYQGDWANAPLFICLTCADAIRRLSWIRDREQQAAETPLAIPHLAATTGDKTAAPYRR